MARRHGTFAERMPDLVQLASVTDPQVLHASPVRTAGRHLRVVPAQLATRLVDRRLAASRARPRGFGVLGSGVALVPLRM